MRRGHGTGRAGLDAAAVAAILAIAGTSSAAHLEENVASARLELDDDMSAVAHDPDTGPRPKVPSRIFAGALDCRCHWPK